MSQNVPSFTELLADCQHSAVHLEMRDVYNVPSEVERIARWKAGHRHDPADRKSWWRPWLDTVASAVERGVVMRRARVVSEPVSEYIRYEHSGTFTNIAAGEQIRWLPRSQASDIALPGNDFWLFDDQLVQFGIFSGNGEFIKDELSNDPDVAKLCSSAFESVWDRAIPHEQFRI